MKKATARGKSAKAKATGKTVDQYLSSVPEPARSTLEGIRKVIRSVVPKEATEVISYGMPAFNLPSAKRKNVIVWYAAFSDHCSLFPTGSVIAKFKDELEGYTISKGTIQFPVDKPLPSALVKRMVKARLTDIG